MYIINKNLINWIRYFWFLVLDILNYVYYNIIGGFVMDDLERVVKNNLFYSLYNNVLNGDKVSEE